MEPALGWRIGFVSVRAAGTLRLALGFLSFRIRRCASHPPAFANTGSEEVYYLALFCLRVERIKEHFFWTGICERELSLGLCSWK